MDLQVTTSTIRTPDTTSVFPILSAFPGSSALASGALPGKLSVCYGAGTAPHFFSRQ